METIILSNSLKNKVDICGMTIYKYLPLRSDVKMLCACDDTELMSKINGETNEYNDLKIFHDLVQKNIWFSGQEMLNDPFELNNVSYEESDEGFGACQMLNLYLNRNSIAIASFSYEHNIMPMWGNYANNHKGFCIEYIIEEQQHIFPVEYTAERLEKAYNYSSMTARTDREREYMGAQLSIKSKDWNYEKEMRIIACNESLLPNEGFLVNEKRLGIKSSKIIAGTNCSVENKRILKLCANMANLEYGEANISKQQYDIIIK